MMLGVKLALASAMVSGGGGHTVITNIALSLVGACALAYLMKLLRQPLILGYILAGVAIGPVGFELITDHTEIITIAEIGLILLLFMIGLEIDLKKMASAGKWVIVPGVLQFPICVGLGYLVFGWLETLDFDLGAGSYARLYAALALGLSSTMIVVKLLFDKMELDTLPGRITVGILVFQDIWAIIVLAVQPNLNDPQILGLAKTFGAGALLVGVALLLSRYVLPSIFKQVARVPELVLVMSLGWCFLVALVAAHPAVGLSMEMGALIAGVSLAPFPYNIDIVAKAISIRDFFITLFFVALGMQIPVPHADVLIVASGIAGVTILTRFVGIFGVLYAMKGGHRASLLATINLAQVSEFSLVILSLGITFGHIEPDTLTYLIWVFSVMAVVSTYLVNYSHGIQRVLSAALSRVGLRDIGQQAKDEAQADHHPIVLLGFFRIASAFFEELTQKQPSLVTQIKVVDLNPQVKAKLDKLGVPCVYGDISHQDSLHHANIHHAELVVCTIPDSFLKGTSNKKMLLMLRALCPHAKVIVTAETTTQARELYDAGADYVLESSQVLGDFLATVVEQGLLGQLAHVSDAAKKQLLAREAVLA